MIDLYTFKWQIVILLSLYIDSLLIARCNLGDEMMYIILYLCFYGSALLINCPGIYIINYIIVGSI